MAADDGTGDQPRSLTETGATPAAKITGALSEISLGKTERSGAVKEVVETRREWARGIVAMMIVGALLIVVVAPFLLMYSGSQISNIKDIVELLVAPVIGIVGAVTGFYFGSSGASPPRGPE